MIVILVTDALKSHLAATFVHGPHHLHIQPLEEEKKSFGKITYYKFNLTYRTQFTKKELVFDSALKQFVTLQKSILNIL